MTDYEQLQFAVWGDASGQNDLVWYRADATGAAYIELSKHREYGKYNIHTYGTKNGKLIGLNATSAEVLLPQIQSSVTKLGQGQFSIDITGVPDSISAIKVPVWSDKDGQNDIIWYTATKIAS